MRRQGRWFAATALVGLALVVSLLANRQSPIVVDGPSRMQPEQKPGSTIAVVAQEGSVPIAALDLGTLLKVHCGIDVSEFDDTSLTYKQSVAVTQTFLDSLRQMTARLSASAIGEHLHTVALVGDKATRFEAFGRAISSSPDNAFLLWRAVTECSEADEGACPLEDWERLLVAVDGHNGETWIRVAANRYRRGQMESALEALELAGAAGESNVFWADTVELIERAYAASSDMVFSQRASEAIGVASARLPDFGDYLQMCRERSSDSMQWAEACLRYGELTEREGKTAIGVSISYSLQEVALDALGDRDGREAINQRREATLGFLNASISDNDVISRMIVSNPTIFSEYLNGVRLAGESYAQHEMVSIAQRLLTQESGPDCTSFIPGS